MKSRETDHLQQAILAIYGLKPHHEYTDLKGSLGYLSIAEAIEIPALHASNLKELKSKHDMEQFKEHAASLIPNVPFMSKVLEDICCVSSASAEIEYHYSLAVFYSIAKWSLSSTNQDKISQIPLLLRTLNWMKNGKYQTLTVSLVYLILGEYRDAADWNLLLSIVQQLKEIGPSLPWDSQYGDILTQLLMYVTDSQDGAITELSRPLAELISSLLYVKQNLFSQSAIYTLFDIADNSLNHFSLPAVVFYATLSHFIPEEKLIENIDRLPAMLFAYITKIPFSNWKRNIPKAIKKEEAPPNTSTFRFYDHPSHSLQFDPESQTMPVDMYVFTDFLDPHMTDIVNSISSSIDTYEEVQKVMFNAFVSLIKANLNADYIQEFVLCYVKLTVITGKKVNVYDFYDCVTMSGVFCPYEEPSEEEDIFPSVRHSIIKFILQRGPSIISIMFEDASKDPYFYCEVVERCILEKILLHRSFFEADNFAKRLYLIGSHLILYAQAEIPGYLNASFAHARLIACLCENSEIHRSLFSVPFFLTYFMSLFFDSSFSRFSTQLFMRTLSVFGENIPNEFYESNFMFFSQLCSLFPDTRSVEMSNHFLEMISQCDCDHGEYLSALHANLSRFTDIDQQTQVKLSALKYVRNLPDNYVFTQSMINATFDLLGESSDEVYNGITKILSGMDHVTPPFSIRHPELLPLFMQKSFDAKFSDVLSLLSELLKFSKDNCKKCHQGKVDLYLVNYLYKNRFDEKLTSKNTRSVIDVFIQIASVISSPIVVYRFISLFITNNNNHLSRHYYTFLDALINLLNHRADFNFSYTLIKLCKPSILYPIFSQLRTPVVNDEMGSYRFGSVKSLLSALLEDSDCQKLIYETKCFPILSYHIYVNQAASFTCYSQLCELITSIKHEQLQTDLFIHLILNIQLWSSSYIKNFISVGNHMMSNLFPVYHTRITALMPLETLIKSISLHITYELHSGDSSVTDIRDCINTIIATYYMDQVTSSIVNLAYGICLGYSNSDDVCEGLKLLSILIRSEFYRIDQFDERPLDSLIQRRNSNVLYSLVEFLVTLYEISSPSLKVKTFKKITIPQKIEILSKQITYTLPPSLIYDLSKFPECFSLCIKHAYLAGPEALDTLFNHMEPSSNYIISWSIWAVYAALKSEKPLRIKILRFIAKFNEFWPTLFALVERVSLILGLCPEDSLESICGIFMENQGEITSKTLSYLIEPVKFFLFYRRDRSHSDMILSSFPEISPRRVSTPGDSSIDDFINVFLTTQLPEANYTFGLRLSNDGKWLDDGLARQTLMILIKFQKEPELASLIAYLISKSDRGYIQSLRLESVIPNYIPLTSLISIPSIFNPSMATLSDSVVSILSKFMEIVSAYKPGDPQSLVSDALSMIQSYRDDLASSFEGNRRTWQFLWHELTFDRAPWSDILTPREIHYKRSTKQFFGYGNLRLSVNRRFDKHEEASEMRRLGIRIEKAPLNHDTYPRKIEPFVSLRDGIVPLVSIPSFYVKISKVIPCQFYLYNTFIKLTYVNRGKSIVIPVADINHVFLRNHMQKPTAIEIFTFSGDSYFINFTTENALKIIQKISSVRPQKIGYIQNSDFSQFFESSQITKKWQLGLMSNFEYLLYLNVFGSRSFNTAATYPIFPWILADYCSDELDLANPETFRDLAKPIGSLGSERIRELQERIQDLAEFGVSPFLYSSYCSSPLTVFHYLIRMEPFTSQHIFMQSGRFDSSSRLFVDIASAYKSAATQINDYKELIPEFFYSSEFLVNENKFDLGDIDGQAIDDVKLPAWSKSPFDFVYKHRKALECEHVSKNLPHWIDLIFGYKRRSLEHLNLYKEEMYEDVWQKEGKEGGMRKAEIEATLENVGQIPPPLFTEPHPKRTISTSQSKRTENSVFSLSMASVQAGYTKVLKSGTLATIVLSSTGDLVCFTQDSTSNDLIYQGFDTDIKCWSKYGVAGLVYALNRGNDLYLIDAISGEKQTIITAAMPILSIATDANWIAVSSEDAGTYIVQDMSLKHTISAYREAVVSCAVSKVFDLVATASRDGFLTLYSLNTGETLSTVDMKGLETTSMLITPSWGFILVTGQLNGKTWLKLYTINGRYVNERQIEGPITSWTVYSSHAGFDYVAASIGKGKIFLFEAYCLNLASPIYRCFSEVVSLSVFKDIETLGIITKEGKQYLIPIPVPYYK